MYFVLYVVLKGMFLIWIFFFNVRIIFVFEFKIDSLRYVDKNVVNRKEGSVKFDKMGNVKKLNSVERNKM